jgi:peptidoglycan LD-endopeptidase CwlK
MDAISVGRIQRLHPKLRNEAIGLFGDAECALKGRAKPRVTFTLRTFAEQQALYEQGRTKPGDIVTNAKPGSSYHNYGLALDFALIIDGKTASWNTLKDFDGDRISDWMEVVNIFKAAGWEWGGDWHSIIDKPHLEKRFGLHWSQLLTMYNNKQIDPQGYVKF